MTASQLDVIFLPFEQVGETRKRTEGTGLGLAISRQLVALMGGDIRVTSEPGHGSRFWFEAEFPVTDAAEPAGPPAYEQISGYEGERRKILVVDDKAENRLVLLNLLEPLGFDVAVAENGQDGVNTAKTFLPDLILMDLVMPVMSGFEAVTAIRQISELQSVPILAVSASVLEMDRAKSRIAGCHDFLSKPIDAETLFARLEEHLELKWTYAEPPAEHDGPTPPSSAVAFPPPQQELEILYELTMFGDLAKVEERVTYTRHRHNLRVRKTPPQPSPKGREPDSPSFGGGRGEVKKSAICGGGEYI